MSNLKKNIKVVTYLSVINIEKDTTLPDIEQ